MELVNYHYSVSVEFTLSLRECLCILEACRQHPDGRQLAAACARRTTSGGEICGWFFKFESLFPLIRDLKFREYSTEQLDHVESLIDSTTPLDIAVKALENPLHRCDLYFTDDEVAAANLLRLELFSRIAMILRRCNDVHQHLKENPPVAMESLDILSLIR